jgi:hypothetical protein
MRIIITLLSLLLISILCKGQPMNKFRKYINNNTEIVSIKYPSDWIAKDYSGIEFVFMRPQVSAGDTGFKENFNLTISGTMGFKSIETYAQALPDKLKDYLKHFVKLSGEILTAGNLKCAKTVYNYSKDGFVVKVALYQFMKHGQVYSITCTATKETYSKYVTVFDKAGNSFKLQ